MACDVLGLPGKGRMLADAFDDIPVLGEQELGLVVAGSHGFEIWSFSIVVENCREKGRDNFEHFGRSRAIVGSQQRIEKPVQLFRADPRQSMHRVGTKFAIHGASEKYRQFAQ